MKRDTLYAEPHSDLVDFTFDQRVADVFPDMIRRSVPGYETILGYMGLFAEKYVTANSHCYDLGCSLGASSLSLRARMLPSATLIAVDNSEAMIENCQTVLGEAKDKAVVEFRCEDILNTRIQNASLVVMNFTLQFIPPEQRNALIEKIYSGLNAGGALVVSEKITLPDDETESYLQDLHFAFKRANGYSDLEISQKRSAIDNVLVRESIEQHTNRFKSAGFQDVTPWFQCLNFASMVAVKAC